MLKKAILGLFDPGPSLAWALRAPLRGARRAQGCAAYGAEDAKQKARFLLCSIFQPLPCSKNVRCLRVPLYQAAENSFSAAW